MMLLVVIVPRLLFSKTLFHLLRGVLRIWLTNQEDWMPSWSNNSDIVSGEQKHKHKTICVSFPTIQHMTSAWRVNTLSVIQIHIVYTLYEFSDKMWGRCYRYVFFTSFNLSEVLSITKVLLIYQEYFLYKVIVTFMVC